MKATETGFLDLFNQKVQYLVPRWHRRYRWGETEIHRLIDDMLAIADAESNERPHYGGTLITVQEASGAPMKFYRVALGIRRRGVFFGVKPRMAVFCALMEDELGEDAPSRAGLWTVRVMPMHLTDAWRASLGPDAEEVHLAWRNRLANLALVGAADDAPGNHLSFDEKKDRYRNSPIALTRRLAEEGDWDEAALLRRSEELAKRAIRVWPWEDIP